MGCSTVSSLLPEFTIMYKGMAFGFARAIFANYNLTAASLPSSSPNITYIVLIISFIFHSSFDYAYGYCRVDSSCPSSDITDSIYRFLFMILLTAKPA